MNPDDAISLGIDIGGTFTDIVVVNESTGAKSTFKELTTPDDPSRGVITGIRRMFERDGLKYERVTRVVHATTLFTNAIIERRGAATGLITTEGFRDVLEIGSERKYLMYDLLLRTPKSLVPRSLRLEVAERVAPDGTVEIELSDKDVIDCAERLVERGVQSVAVVLLHSYANPDHEKRIRDLLEQKFPDLFVSISSEVSPQIREYERASTTVANAYVKPLANLYLDRLAQALKGLSIGCDLFLMLSNGGLTNIKEAKRKPIEMLESGPAAGALSAAHFAALSGVLDVLAFDMGGTTAKLAMVDGGKPLIAYSFEAARDKRFVAGSGLPITISTVELLEIGAGGGSIAQLDELGLLSVGPRSAGSSPGPACYMRGGDKPTVTDANLLLGYLDPDFFAGGTISINRDAAEKALSTLGERSGLDIRQIAWGIHDVVNENMSSAARVHIAERGKDPRSYAILTTGGGGPLHGCEVARKLGIEQVIVPPSAGVASAIGMLIAPARVDRARTMVRRLHEIDWSELENLYRSLEDDAKAVVVETGLDPRTAKVTRYADMRYAGQGFELIVKLPAGPYGNDKKAEIVAAFEEVYKSIFSRVLGHGAVQFVNLRVSLEVPAARAKSLKTAVAGSNDALKRSRMAYFGSLKDYVSTPVYDRAKLGVGSDLTGPAIVEELESTLIVPPQARVRVTDNGNIQVNLTGG